MLIELYYVVKPGDTLSQITERWLGRARLYPLVAAINRISDPSLIFPGQVIRLA